MSRKERDYSRSRAAGFDEALTSARSLRVSIGSDRSAGVSIRKRYDHARHPTGTQP